VPKSSTTYNVCRGKKSTTPAFGAVGRKEGKRGPANQEKPKRGEGKI